MLFSVIDRLEAIGTAESPELSHSYDLTHFRPQWIYARSDVPDVRVEVFPVPAMDDLLAEISAMTGVAVAPETRNRREQFDLPDALAALLASSRVKQALRRAPGAGLAKAAVRRLFAGQGGDGFGLDDAGTARIEDFARRFYARDIEVFGC